jgi:hypothetical protein
MDIQSKAEISGYLNSHLEVYNCQTHTSYEKKKNNHCQHKFQCLFSRYLYMLEPVTFIVPLNT